MDPPLRRSARKASKEASAKIAGTFTPAKGTKTKTPGKGVVTEAEANAQEAGSSILARVRNFVSTGGCGPLVASSIALTIVCVVNAVEPWVAEHGPTMFKPYYDTTRDHTQNKMTLGAIAGYYGMCSVCSLLDLCPSLRKWKTQGNRSYFTLREWLDAVALASVNMFVFSWMVTIPIWHYIHRNGILRGGTPLARAEDEIVWTTAILNFIAHSCIIDVWFYSTHRLLHVPPFYKWIHKLHHRFKAPTAVACMYANPIEYNIGNVMGVVLGPAITNCHPSEACFWMAFSLVTTAGTHSGYYLFAAENHDWHHEHFDYQYGTMLMDTIFGTRFKGSEKWKRVMERKANAASKAE